MIDLEAMQIFCDVVATGSFSRAAERNFLSQSAVSQRLRTLERDYGQTLLDRGQGRGSVKTTEAGALLYEGARRLLRDAAALDTQVRGLSEEIAGIVRVATVYSVGLHALPPRLKPFLAANPRVSVHLEYKQTDQVYQDVMAGSVDVGIVACPRVKRGLEIIPFGDEQMAVICAPENPWADQETIRLSQLEGAPFFGFADDIPTRKLVDDRLRAAGVRVRLVAAFDNIETIKNLVEIGSGVSILPIETVEQEVRSGTLAVLLFTADESFLRPTGMLIKNSAFRRPAVRAFLKTMRVPSVT